MERESFEPYAKRPVWPPKELYLDNAKVYHSNALKSACSSTNVRLIHRKPGDPAPGGLIERFFRTVQDQL